MTFGPVRAADSLCLLGSTDTALPTLCTAAHKGGGQSNNHFAVILPITFWWLADLQCPWVTGWFLLAYSLTWRIGIHTRSGFVRLSKILVKYVFPLCLSLQLVSVNCNSCTHCSLAFPETFSVCPVGCSNRAIPIQTTWVMQAPSDQAMYRGESVPLHPFFPLATFHLFFLSQIWCNRLKKMK